MKRYEKLNRIKRTVEEYTSVMKSHENILEIENLETCFFTDNGVVRSVNNISFNVPKNAIVGLVGESGCGKSVTSLSIMKLVQAPQGQVTGGEIRLAPGTMYGSLSKMEKDGLITFVREVEKRKLYVITDLGKEVLDLEINRIKRLYSTVEGVL
jgi:peptide/nickel transport system ATP-binding protein